MGTISAVLRYASAESDLPGTDTGALRGVVGRSSTSFPE